MRSTIRVFSPDYCFEHPDNDCLVPEKALLAAIVWRAYWDLGPRATPTQQLLAIRWFDGNITLDNGFYYRDIVDILDLSAKYQKIIKDAVREATFRDRTYDHKSKTEGKASRTPNCAVVNRVRRRVSAAKPAV